MEKQKLQAQCALVERTGSVLPTVIANGLVLMEVCKVKDYIENFQPQLQMKASLEGINIHHVSTSKEIEFLQTLAIPGIFDVQMRSVGTRRRIKFVYVGEKSNELLAWRSVGRVVEVFKERFSDEWKLRSFIDMDTQMEMETLLTQVHAHLGYAESE